MPARPPAPAPILVIDDEADLRELLDISLRRMGHDVVMAGSLAEARLRLAERRYSLVLTDMRLGDGLGIEIVRQLSASPERTPVAVITAYGSADNAVDALKAGAFDYIAKPVSLEQLRTLILNALGRQHRAPADGGSQAAESSELADRAAQLLPGVSAAVSEVRRSLSRLARSMAPVVISGESGSGKERAARAIHAISARSAHPFVAVNCGAIPETLMESEFFGYVKGAFTGADAERGGFFQAAHGGTLLLDEVADLPLAMQVKLLRALQERRVRKIGASKEDSVDVRVMCASHKDLAAMVAAGSFRQDLYYRLNVLELRMPTLRERGEDVPVLAHAILEHMASRYGDAHPKRLSRAALERLMAYPFPGNVRELENLLERAYAFAETDEIAVADLGPLDAGMERASLLQSGMAPMPVGAPVAAPAGYHAWGSPTPWVAADASQGALADLAAGVAGQGAGGQREEDGASDPLGAALADLDFPIDLPARLEAVERELILRALRQTGFNRTAAAPLLGLNFRQLRYRIQQLGIRDERDGRDGRDDTADGESLAEGEGRDA
ncbi:sigma-54 dependent transcriptional regulator [Cupriavidus sp.]|uniref:sigma-54-dependent transcriptional regulator n=1 Tax=Cupriavidus sp. TaxID=1873897 RepID=UPI0025BF611F|nr:sigma-54 dependent transcriptional regulator [Cupriavidus sp.]MCA3187486.1 sigma-54-dependent Fis family transcriptional regulator [Cupriavidus sp.]MCA3189945.1 sigma-54-dependent Fis family transcriptional regulator [Cupriavidus sp.]MCA3196844.1 sigma-54-dependent Fis family transcriptional regulator [Cupriavidus sp.]MCA3204343.1 sigma-54-dependent Fis family transcriptional regulator [Cupriavidus sp.]MCA3208949.1 sigma-54-dependent Fis family transcriptional regulator [Cupriavidus sp.]